MRIRFTETGLHRIGDTLVDVRSTDEVVEVGHENDIARYTIGLHYVIHQDPPTEPAEPSREPGEPTEPVPPVNPPEAESAPKSKGGRGAGARE